jgi:hypothetical protein
MDKIIPDKKSFFEVLEFYPEARVLIGRLDNLYNAKISYAFGTGIWEHDKDEIPYQIARAIASTKEFQGKLIYTFGKQVDEINLNTIDDLEGLNEQLEKFRGEKSTTLPCK